MTNTTPQAARRGQPLRVMFVITSMPVGGAEMLLVNLLTRMNRRRFAAEICCLKEAGALAAELPGHVPVHSRLLAGKYDVRVLPRLVRLLRRRRIDAVVTVGAGDKMFWGRLAAWLARVPVVTSAIHSTGWPDGIGWLNRRLTPITDAVIGVAANHGKHLIEVEKLPAHKVHVIPNGVDVSRFAALPGGEALRAELGLPPAVPVVGIVAALRKEKNHGLFLEAAAQVLRRVPETRFLIVGDGPERPQLEARARGLGLSKRVQFLGTRRDVAAILSLLDLFVLTSDTEANPVSILEAMAAGKPVVATRVGSVEETVRPGLTGQLVARGDSSQVAHEIVELLNHPLLAREMGTAGRLLVSSHFSLDGMVGGYQRLLTRLYEAKKNRRSAPSAAPRGRPTADAGSR